MVFSKRYVEALIHEAVSHNVMDFTKIYWVLIVTINLWKQNIYFLNRSKLTFSVEDKKKLKYMLCDTNTAKSEDWHHAPIKVIVKHG